MRFTAIKDYILYIFYLIHSANSFLLHPVKLTNNHLWLRQLMNEIICRLQTEFTISISIMHVECGICLFSSFSYILENAEFYTMDYVLEVDN